MEAGTLTTRLRRAGFIATTVTYRLREVLIYYKTLAQSSIILTDL
jgi:hypothetical protein